MRRPGVPGRTGQPWSWWKWQTIVKAADESVSASTVVQNDDELFFTTISGASYEIELTLIYASPAGGGTPDFKFDLGEDATARGAFFVIGFDTADASNTGVFAANQTSTSGGGTATAKRVLSCRGTYQGAGGTFRLRWAQNTSNPNAVTLYAGSVLRYRRIA